ncbi:MAG: hypothetical protein N3E46_12060 [Gemmataceae bacterium]|nr:hypothetical protein [Gemmataceae bacterium]
MWIAFQACRTYTPSGRLAPCDTHRLDLKGAQETMGKRKMSAD